MRRATVALHITCRFWATGVATGERGDTETVTPRSERGDWKRAMIRWYLASRLLNLGHPFKKETLLSFHRPPLSGGQVILRHRRSREMVLMHKSKQVSIGSDNQERHAQTAGESCKRPLEA